jgi:hypothetical protein
VWSRRSFCKSALGALVAPLCWPSRSSAAVLARFPYIQNVGPNRATLVWTTEERGHGGVWVSSQPVIARLSPSAPSRRTEVRLALRGRIGIPDRTALLYRDSGPARWVSSIVRELRPEETELATPYYRHTVELAGLDPSAEYFYAPMLEGQNLWPSDKFNFRTAGGGPFSFLAFGDSGAGSPEQAALAELIRRERPAFVLHLGDLAYPRGAFVDYQSNYFGVYQDIMRRIPFFPCPGNHGYMTRDAFPYVMVHAVPTVANIPEIDRGRYYSFDWGDVHFVSIDSNAPLVRASEGKGPMLQWLEYDLRSTRKFWKIVYFHHPPYAGGPNETDPLSTLARQYLAPIVERYGVQLVLNGHEHSYQRSHPIRNRQIVAPGEGTVYVTSGGGGKTTYPIHYNPYVATALSVYHYLRLEVNRVKLTVRAIGLGGVEIDRIGLGPLG